MLKGCAEVHLVDVFQPLQFKGIVACRDLMSDQGSYVEILTAWFELLHMQSHHRLHALLVV